MVGGARKADGQDLYWRITQFMLPTHSITPSAMPDEVYYGYTWVPVDDESCWIYIYGWPAEQGAIWLLGGHAAWWQVFLIALPAAAALAFLSWHLVERPALRFKPATRRPSVFPRREAGVEGDGTASMASLGQS